MIEATLTRYDEETDEETELEVEAEYDFYPGCRGAREQFGVPLEPDEPPMVEVHSVRLAATGEEIELTEEDYEELERVAWSDHEGRVEDAKLARYEAMSERLYGYSVL
jgi:hypothetical protein